MTQLIAEARNRLPLPDPDPDMPAESIRIRIDDDDDSVLQWLDNLHPVYDRHDSTKGTTNPKSNHHHHHHHQQQQQQQQNPNPSHNSHHFSGNLKATTKAQIIGLPGAAASVQHSGHIGHCVRRHPPPPPIFPPKKRPAGASSSLSDPVSPKVSCFGSVRSERRRSESSAAVEKGCWSSVLACFGRRKAITAEASGAPAAKERSVPARVCRDGPEEPPGIGGMKKFVSGRRSASFGGDVEVDLDGGENGHVPWSGPLIRR
ncbi:uncharacterized protein M6B38_114195 [Iris pallida]|uniref:Uncharacterized protein n=1 Tax=Iris pallida TaxID=29817 RepID=A0AAX6IL17_IRIPA|nr:uncharacterized protein M6B38_114195 [Iris pallida]